MEIPRVRKKNHVEFLRALVFYLGISKGVSHNSAEFPGVVVSGNDNNNYNKYVKRYLKSKGSQSMKFRQSTEYEARNIFL